MTVRPAAPWLLVALLAVPPHALRVVATSGTRIDGVVIAGVGPHRALFIAP